MPVVLIIMADPEPGEGNGEEGERVGMVEGGERVAKVEGEGEGEGDEGRDGRREGGRVEWRY